MLVFEKKKKKKRILTAFFPSTSARRFQLALFRKKKSLRKIPQNAKKRAKEILSLSLSVEDTSPFHLFF